MMNFIRNFLLYPSVDRNSNLFDGIIFKQPSVCKNCKTLQCSTFIIPTENVIHHTCDKNISIFSFTLNGENLILNGLIEPNLNIACPKGLKKRLRNQKVTIDKIIEYKKRLINSNEDLSKILDHVASNARGEIAASFHSIKSATSLLFRNIERVIFKDFQLIGSDEFDSLSPEEKALYQTLFLLQEQLSFSTFVMNPEAVSYGKKHKCEVYKLFHKFSKIYEGQANKQSISISLQGGSFTEIKAYDSIASLVMVLLDNAIKYSKQGSEIRIKFNDTALMQLIIEISSIGPIVAKDNREKIFDKGYRSPSAKQYSYEGYGMGLYIGKLIAQAHQFELEYECRELNEKEGVNLFRIITYGEIDQ